MRRKTLSPSTNGSNGRDRNGRFAKGNPGGPGNPFARQVAALRREMIATVGKKDIKDIFKELVKKAKKGDLRAAKLVLGYCIGPPMPFQDPDTIDERELKNNANFYKAESEMHKNKPSIMDRIHWNAEN